MQTQIVQLLMGAGTKEGVAIMLELWPETLLHLGAAACHLSNRLFRPGESVEVEFDGGGKEIADISRLRVGANAHVTVVDSVLQPSASDLPEVTFRPKNPFQKDDCINRGTDYDCQNPSTLEAVYGNASIRCCDEERCRNRAAELAKKAAF